MISLRYALRSLRRSPGFVALSVLALGAGLGMSTTMFAVMDAVLNPHVAYRSPGQLFNVGWWIGPRQTFRDDELWEFFRNSTRSYEAVVAVHGSRQIIDIAGDQQLAAVQRVGWRYFDLLGVRPLRGRVFSSSEADDVAMVSEALWRRLYGTRQQLGGATITIAGRQRTIIGILPRSSGAVAVMLPLPPAGIGRPDQSYGRPLVRLRQGISRQDADRELKLLARTLNDRFGAHDAPYAFELYPLVSTREEVRDLHKAMMGASLAVLLIACVNLAHLMMARGFAKRRELALRLAMGARRGVVVRQLFLECIIVAGLGALLGVLVTVWGADILRNRIPREVSWIGFVQPQLSWRVFTASALAALGSAVLFGLLPAIRVVRSISLDESLKDGAGTMTHRVRWRYNPLVAAEVGLALALLMGAGLLLRTVWQLRHTLGQEDHTLWSATVMYRDAAGLSPEALLTAARAMPGVRDVALTARRALPGSVVTAEMSGDSNRTLTMTGVPMVSAAYLRVLGLPIVDGRDFDPSDGTGPGVAIIDASAAARLYPGIRPVGRMLKLGGPMHDAPWIRIVGLVRNPRVLEQEYRYQPQPHVFVSLPAGTPAGGLVIRTHDDAAVPARFNARLRSLPDIQGSFVMPFDAARRADMRSRLFLAQAFVGMGLVALSLAGLGLYGVLAYAVGCRMREFAVRLALGCEPRALRRMVLYDGFVMLLAGIGVGAFVALAASRWLDAVLIAVLPSDVISLVACEITLLVVGLAAALAPARRAAQANPLDILRAS